MNVFGDHHERWEAPLAFWREPDCEAQWREGVTRIVDGAETSRLVTVMTGPGAGQLAQFWTLYRFGEEVAVHEQLWLESEQGLLDPAKLYDVAGRYGKSLSKDGTPPSEWRLSLSDLRDWLRS